MVYTIGNTDNYRKGLSKYGVISKKGKDDNYQGGSVWRTPEEAVQFLLHSPNRIGRYSVFEVDANFDKDTTVNESGLFNDLLVTSTITREVVF